MMTEERLNGLASVYTHKDIAVDINNVLDRFAKKTTRRIQLSNILFADKPLPDTDGSVSSEVY